MRRFALIFLGLATLIASAAAQNALPPVKWRTLAEGDQSAATQFERHFMYSEADIQTYLGKLKPGPMRASLRVDWNKEMVIAVHMGQRNTGGFKVYVETIDRTTAAVACVRCVEVHPAPRGPVSQAKTSPWIMIAVERPGNVEWQFTSRAIQGQSVKRGCHCFCKPCGCRQPYYGSQGFDLPWHSGNLNSNMKPLGQIPYQEYDWGRQSNFRSMRTFVIRSEDSFMAYWKEAFGDKLLPRRSGIDWRRDLFVAIHIGEVRQGQFPTLAAVNRNWNQTVDVYYTVNLPQPYNSGVKESPFVSFLMPNYGDTVTFKGYTNAFDSRVPCDCGCACGRR